MQIPKFIKNHKAIGRNIIQFLTLPFLEIYEGIHTLVHGIGPLGWIKITDNIYLGGQFTKDGVKKLKDLGINTVLNLRENGNKEDQFEHYLQIPTVDKKPISQDDLIEGFNFIEGAIKNEEKIYIHCKHGRGRSVSMVIAYLGKKNNWTFEESFNFVKSNRPLISPNKNEIAAVKKFLND